MDLGSESSEDEDMEEFRYDMDIDEHRFLVLCFIMSRDELKHTVTYTLVELCCAFLPFRQCIIKLFLNTNCVVIAGCVGRSYVIA